MSRSAVYRGGSWVRRVGRRVGSWVGAGIKLFGGVAVLAMSTVPSHLWANPQGEQVVGGAASFNRPDAATLIVNQHSDRAVINWNSFSIANGELTRFVQPSSTSAALNRVVTANPSQIYGTLQANGQIYLINPGGVMVGPGGVVDVAGFVASTHDVGNEEFMRGGNLNFHGNSEASILNQGRVEAREGDVFLVAREVKNEGQLMAKDGTVGMVSGTEVSLQAVGQGNYKIRLLAAEDDPTTAGGGRREAGGEAEIVNEGVIQAANAVLEAKGSYLPMAIKNTGVIEATGLVKNGDGTVSLTGGEGDILNIGVVAALQRSLDGQKEIGGSVLMTGKNVTSDPGSIITAAGSDGGGTVKLRAADTTILRGEISVVGTSESAKGGQVQLLGERVGLFDQAKVDASGGAGGGEVLVGGDYLGNNPEILNAKATVMGSEAKIIADATANGDGGRVILWSDEYTGFYGDISARGGVQGGNGGFVETSSKFNLQAFGSVDLNAFKGVGGQWLLDPSNVTLTGATAGGTFDGATPINTFTPTAAAATAFITTIQNSLNVGTSVTILTTSDQASAGNITVAGVITAAPTGGLGAATTLSLIAAGGITINAGSTITFTNPGILSLQAGGGIQIGANIAMGTGTVLMVAGTGNFTSTSPGVPSPSGGSILLSSGTETITAGRVGLSAYSIGSPTAPLRTIGGNAGAVTIAALASGGSAANSTDNKLNSNSGIFIANQGVATIGTVVDVAGFVSTGQGGILFENNNNTIISSGISSNGGPVYISTTSGAVAVNSTVQASSNAPNPTLRATVGIYGDGGITNNEDGAITATRLALASDNSDIVLDSGLHVVTQLAGDTGTTGGNFTFSGGSFYVGTGAYYLPGVTPGTGVVTSITGIDAQTAVTLTSSGDIIPVPATLTSSPVTVRAAGGAGIVARTLQGGAIRLDGANDSSGTVSLRSNNGTDLGAGNITYTEATGDLALANLQTTGRATINFDGNLTQTGIIQVGTLNFQGTGLSGSGDDALLNLANQIGAIRGQIVGNLTLTDTGTSLFPGLVVGEEVGGNPLGLTSTTGNITLTTDGNLTQVGGITATGGAGTPPTAGFLTVDALSITLDLAVAGVSLNNVNQISLASTGGNTIYRDFNGYYVQRAVAPNPNGATRGEGGARFVSLAADSGIVRDDIAAALDLTDTMSGDGLVLLSSGSANFDLQNFTTASRNPYNFDSFAASGVGSDFYFRDTDYLVISTVNGTAGVSTGGDLVLTAGGDVTQDATISSNNLRVTIRSAGGNYLVLSGANDVTNVSLQTRTNAGGDDPDPNSGAAANGLIYFRDVDDFQIGVNIPIGIVDPGAAVTGVVTLQGNLNTGVSNVVLESGVLSSVIQLNDPGALVSTTGLGLIGGDFTIDQGTAPDPNALGPPDDSANNVSFLATQTLDNDILYRELDGFAVSFVRMEFPDTFDGGLTQADFQVNGIQAGDVVLQVQAPTSFTLGGQQQGIRLLFSTDAGDGRNLLSGFSTTDMNFDSPGYIESSGRVVVTIGNSDGAGGATEVGRFTMDEGIHIITTVDGSAHPTNGIGNRDIAILADNMVLGRDGNPAVLVDGLIQTPDIKDTALQLLETVTLAPFSNTRQLFVSSPKAELINRDTTITGNPNQLELSAGELRRVNTDRLILRSSYTNGGGADQTPAINVRSPVNLYGLYDDTFVALGVFPNNAGVNRLQIQAAGDTGVAGAPSQSYAWVESEISSDINQLPLQVFVVSANNPYTTPDSGVPAVNLPTQGDRVVVSGGIRSYGGTVILRGQDATITGAINATAQGLVGIMPAVGLGAVPAVPGVEARDISLGSEVANTLSILRSELGLITAGTVQIGSLTSDGTATPSLANAMPSGISNNPFYVSIFESVNSGRITISDRMSGLSADTIALLTDAGVEETDAGGVVAPGLALIGGISASVPGDNRDFLLNGSNNDVDRLAVYMADTSLTPGNDPVQNVVYHDQNGFGGGNGFEVAFVQQQAEQGLTRATAAVGNIPVGTGLGLIRANQLSITAGGDVTVYDVIPTGGPTSTSYIGHVPSLPGVPVLVLGNLVNLLAIDASTPSPETGGVNEVFFSAANGLGVGDLEALDGGVAGILTNGGNVTLEANDMDIQPVDRVALGDDDITIDTTFNGVAPDGARVVLRPATGFNGFVDRPGAGAPVEIELGAIYVAPAVPVAQEALDGILNLAQEEIGAARMKASILEIGSRSNPATASGKIRIVPGAPGTGLEFNDLTQVFHLLSGGAIEDDRATTGTADTGIILPNGGVAAEANGSISLIGARNSIGTFAAESNFGQSEVRLVNNRATVLGTVDGVSGILASTFAAQLTAGGLTQTPGSSIEAGLLSINTSAGPGSNVTLNSENGVAQVAINAGGGNILLRTTGNTRIVSAAASQPGGVPGAVSGLTGTLITLYSGGDVTQDANAPITGAGATPTAVTVVTQNGFSITLDAGNNRLPANSVFAATTSSGALGNLVNLTLVNGALGGGLELGSGAVIDLTLISAGSGYTGFTGPGMTVSAPSGGGTTATGQVVAGVKTIAVSSGGAGYLSAPTVTIGGTGGAAAVAIVDTNPLSATYGQVTSIQITDPGTGYLALPTVTLSGGSPAQAATVAATELQITGLVITNPGSRYDATPTVTITGTGGSGAAGTSTIGGTGGVYFAGGSAVSGGITGNLNIRNAAGTGITQQTAGTAGAISVEGTTTLADSSNAGINLGNNNNNLQGTITVTQSGGGNVSIGNGNSSILGNLTLSGGLGAQTLAVTTIGGSIYQANNANVITSPGAASFLATDNGLASGTPVGSVILNNALNNFGGALSAVGTRVVIRDSGPLQLGSVTASTSLVATSAGNFTQSGAINVTGTGASAINATGTVTLSQNSSFGGDLSVISTDAGNDIRLEGGILRVGGNLAVTSARGITQVNPSTISVTGNTTFTAAGGNSISVGQANTFTGTVTFAASAGNLANITVRDTTALDLGALTLGAGGNLSVTAAGITQSGPLVVPGTITLVAGGSNITLNNAANNFGTVVITSANNANLRTLGPVILSGPSSLSGDLTLVAGGNITNGAGITFGVGGLANFNAGASSITLGSGGSTFNFGSLDLTGGVVTVTESSAMVLAGVSAATLDLAATSGITQTGAVTVAGNSTFTANAGQSILLGNSGNNFNDTVEFNAAGLGNLDDVTLFDQSAITTQAGGLTIDGALTLTSLAGITFNDISSGSLTATAGGAVAQNGPTILTIGGDTVISASGQNISLGNLNQFTGPVSLLGADITISDASGLILGTTTATGSLQATVNAGNISQSGAIRVSGTSGFTAVAGSNISLGNPGNFFLGQVTFSPAGTLANITLANTSSFQIQPGGLTISGDLNLTANGITQAGPIDVGGTTTLNGGRGAIVLANSGNAYGGTVSITGGASADMFFDLDDDGLVGPVTVNGAFTLRTDPGTGFELGDSGAGPFKLDSDQLGGFRVGTFAPVADNANILILDAFNYTGIRNLALTTEGGGFINATAPVTTGTLSLRSADAATFTAVNSIGNLGTVSIGNGGLTLLNNRGMSLTGTATMSGRLSLEVAGQFYNLTGTGAPLAGVGGGSVIKSLSLAGGLPGLLSGMAGFAVRYDGRMPASGNVMSYAVSPLTMFAPDGTEIAGVNLGGTQTGGGQLNTFFTGSDNLNWMIADFGKFNLPKVEPARMEYMLYQQRVEPETRSLPQPVMRELTMELGRPPTVVEVQAREIAKREALRLRSGALLERSSFDGDGEEPKQEAMAPAPILDGGKPQAGGPSVAPSPLRGGVVEGFGPQAKKQTDTKRDPNGPMLRNGPQRAVALRVEPVDAAQILQAERERAEVNVAPPVAATPR